jgi:hypothetical protein
MTGPGRAGGGKSAPYGRDRYGESLPAPMAPPIAPRPASGGGGPPAGRARPAPGAGPASGPPSGPPRRTAPGGASGAKPPTQPKPSSAALPGESSRGGARSRAPNRADPAAPPSLPAPTIPPELQTRINEYGRALTNWNARAAPKAELGGNPPQNQYRDLAYEKNRLTRALGGEPLSGNELGESLDVQGPPYEPFSPRSSVVKRQQPPAFQAPSTTPPHVIAAIEAQRQRARDPAVVKKVQDDNAEVLRRRDG